MMKNKLHLILAIAAGVILFALLNRRAAGNLAPVNQTGAAGGGVNFQGSDLGTGLPIFFYPPANPALVKNLAPDISGSYVCPVGTTPAFNGVDGRIYCVIPAESGYPNTTPVVASVAPTQGPTQDGPPLGLYTPQGPGLPGQGSPSNPGAQVFADPTFDPTLPLSLDSGTAV
jgi:hypothetical protein